MEEGRNEAVEGPHAPCEHDKIFHIIYEVILPMPVINQTAYGPVQHNPAAIVMKAQGARAVTDGRLQLLTGIALYFQRMHMLLSSIAVLQQAKYASTDRGGHDASSTGNLEEVATTSVPFALVEGSCWTLYLARDNAEEVSIVKAGMLGSTESPFELYKLLASLRALAEWADGSYRSWLERYVVDQWKQVVADTSS